MRIRFTCIHLSIATGSGSIRARSMRIQIPNTGWKENQIRVENLFAPLHSVSAKPWIRIRRNYMQKNRKIAKKASLLIYRYLIVTINFSISWLKAKERKLAVPECALGSQARLCPRPGCGPLCAPAASCSGLLVRFSRHRVTRGSAPRELQQKKTREEGEEKATFGLKISYWCLSFSHRYSSWFMKFLKWVRRSFKVHNLLAQSGFRIRVDIMRIRIQYFF